MINTLKYLEAAERKGTTCEDCIFHPCCDGPTIPLCYSFEPKNPEPVVSKN